MAKKLFKSRNRVLFGVCGGIAEFFNIDATIVRILMLVLVFAGFGSGIIIYIAAAILMPERSVDNGYADDNVNNMRDARAYDNPSSAGSRSDDEFNKFFDNGKK